DQVTTSAGELGLNLMIEELATLAERSDMGESELEAVASVFAYLARKSHETTIATMLRLSRLPRKEPKTFEGFDFSRIQGRDAAALKKLSALTNLHARKKIALIGPHGIGKTHLAQAYGYECCQRGYKAYILKATELRDKLAKAAKSGNPAKTIGSLVKPSCLIIDEIGRCTFDKACTDLFFDVIDRRYDKECPNTLILTSNFPVINWDEFFTGDETLLCMLDRVFDKATVFMMKGPSYRGAGLDTYSVEAVPSAIKLR
ncbi:MAG TPA: AAA family ATPase, partial [Coriobacteriia bacterium]|nr:AAA family ATPase [Coriobacteriia bacterium]